MRINEYPSGGSRRGIFLLSVALGGDHVQGVLQSADNGG